MGRKLRYLGPSERVEIEGLHNGGAPAAVIAEKVGSHVATIYREVLNGYTGTVAEYGRRVYSAETAQRGGHTVSGCFAAISLKTIVPAPEFYEDFAQYNIDIFCHSANSCDKASSDIESRVHITFIGCTFTRALPLVCVHLCHKARRLRRKVEQFFAQLCRFAIG